MVIQSILSGEKDQYYETVEIMESTNFGRGRNLRIHYGNQLLELRVVDQEAALYLFFTDIDGNEHEHVLMAVEP